MLNYFLALLKRIYMNFLPEIFELKNTNFNYRS